MLACYNINPEMQRAFAEVIFLMSSTLQLSAHIIYKEKKKKKEKNVDFCNILSRQCFTNLAVS